MPTVVRMPRSRQRRPSAMESLTDPPLESSTMVAPSSVAAARELVEIPGLSAVTMPTALTQPVQSGWQATQLNCIGSLRSSSVAAALRGTGQRRDDAGQCDAQGGGAEQRPAAKIERPRKPQNWFLPQAPNQAVAMAPSNAT